MVQKYIFFGIGNREKAKGKKEEGRGKIKK